MTMAVPMPMPMPVTVTVDVRKHNHANQIDDEAHRGSVKDKLRPFYAFW